MTAAAEPEQPVGLPADPIEGGIRFGVAGARVVDVTGLTRRETEEIAALGRLTPGQWGSAHTTRPASRRWPQVVDALGIASQEVLAATAPAGHLVAVSADLPVVEVLRAALPASIRLESDPLVIAALAHAREPLPDLVVLGADRVVAPHRYQLWRRLGVRHVPLIAGPHRVQVGPLVTGGGPCLRCLDLYRTDRDQAWPAVVAGAGSTLAGPGPTGVAPELLAAAGGLLAVMVRAVLSGAEPPAGLAVAVSDRGPWVLYHRWEVHPACGCDAPAGRRGAGGEQSLAG